MLCDCVSVVEGANGTDCLHASQARLEEHAKDHPNDHNMYIMELESGYYLDARLKVCSVHVIRHPSNHISTTSLLNQQISRAQNKLTHTRAHTHTGQRLALHQPLVRAQLRAAEVERAGLHADRDHGQPGHPRRHFALLRLPGIG